MNAEQGKSLTNRIDGTPLIGKIHEGGYATVSGRGIPSDKKENG